VVASKDEEVLRIFNLVGKEEANDLETLLPAVHVVS